MSKRDVHSRPSVWLQLYLVASILLYLYSPFIDHAFGFEGQSRPHTHIHIDAPEAVQRAAEASHTDDDHADTYLCALDIDAVLTLLLGFFDATLIEATPQETVVVAPAEPYTQPKIFSPLVVTPPPNLL